MGLKEVVVIRLNLFREKKREVAIAQVYISVTIFEPTKNDLAQDFSLIMKIDFDMSLLENLNSSLGFKLSI